MVQLYSLVSLRDAVCPQLWFIRVSSPVRLNMPCAVVSSRSSAPSASVALKENSTGVTFASVMLCPDTLETYTTTGSALRMVTLLLKTVEDLSSATSVTLTLKLQFSPLVVLPLSRVTVTYSGSAQLMPELLKLTTPSTIKSRS